MRNNRLALIIAAISLLLLVVPAGTAHAGNGNEITLGNVLPGDMAMKGFTLAKESRVKIDGAFGVFYDRNTELVIYGWIINSETREVAWHMLNMDDRVKTGVHKITARLTLPAGDYEVYYTAQSNHSDKIGDRNIVEKLIDIIVDPDRRQYDRKYRKRLDMTVSSRDLTEADPVELADMKNEDAIVSIVRAEDDKQLHKAFSLSAETRLKLYALGEGSRRSVYDSAWIENIETGRRVWVMNGRDAEHAGGAEKNLVVEETLTLPAGKYLVHYNTDDSHSYEEWNSLPPNDPQSWGITVRTANPADLKNAKPLKDFKLPEPVLELVKVRDDEMVARAIRVKTAMKLRVLCVGEGDGGREMYDYGWIINAETREPVWKMKGRKTEHAGGAEKNRMIDEIIRLEKGTYIVSYATDGSHSYRDWNAAQPFYPKRWGITLWVTKEENRENIETTDVEKVKYENVLAQITHIRNRRDRMKRFTLDKDTKVRIIAIGEGTSSDMADYGWIEKVSSGATVWEMTYRKTEHAGGAKKNRMFNDTILLEKGDYELHFVTDGSHAFMQWNATPPHDPDSYGITVIKENK